MKMAKPTDIDIGAGDELLNILNTIDARFGGPWPTNGPENLEDAIGEEEFDRDNTNHLRGLYNSLAKLLREAPNFHTRIIAGMCHVIMWDQNQIIDQNSPTLDLHPKFEETRQERDELHRINTLLFQDAYSVYIDACESAGHNPETMESWKPKYLRVIERHAKTKGGAQ